MSRSWRRGWRRGSAPFRRILQKIGEKAGSDRAEIEFRRGRRRTSCLGVEFSSLRSGGWLLLVAQGNCERGR